MKLLENTKKILLTVQKDLNIENFFASPRLDKVFVAIGIGSLATRKGIKDFSEIEANLKKITGQKPYLILSKRSISNFKLRDGMPSMLKVTLRGQKAYDFLFKVSKIVLPRVRDFEGMLMRSFDKEGGYSFGLKTYDIFPELVPDDVNIEVGLQISILSTVKNKDYNKKLLEGLGFVFKEKK